MSQAGSTHGLPGQIAQIHGKALFCCLEQLGFFGIMVIWYYGLRGTTVPGAGWVLQGCEGAKLHAVFGG